MTEFLEDAPLRTAIVGFGQVGAGYADDPVMARYYPFATHAQALRAHPGFNWQGVVDVSEAALQTAQTRWNIPHTARSVEELAQVYSPEVAVLATPPATRSELLSCLPDLRAVLVEKPLGENRAQSEAFLAECARRGIVVQVNLWRRADKLFQELAAGQLQEVIGDVQAVFAVYGNGLRNNGTHLVDFARMLFGEITCARIAPGVVPTPAGPLPGDVQVPFTLHMGNGICLMAQPVNFTHYRENSLDIWGTRGRLCIEQEGLNVRIFPRCPHRATQDEHEIASDCAHSLPSTVGNAFYRMYDNLANVLLHNTPLCSSGESALRTTEIVEDLMRQANTAGKEHSECWLCGASGEVVS